MTQLLMPAPHTIMEPVTDVLHGTRISDPYRWLEDQEAPRTRKWIQDQTAYARSYLDNIPGRDAIRKRIYELLAVETYDAIHVFGNRYLFKKRLAHQEQPCIYVRDGLAGKDELLIDPATRGTGPHTAVTPIQLSPDGHLLLYEVKQGGERTGVFELFDMNSRERLQDVFPRGYLRGFLFEPDSQGFFYVHEPLESSRPHYRAVRRHRVGTSFHEDSEVFCAGEDPNIRLSVFGDGQRLGFHVYKFLDRTLSDIYLSDVGGTAIHQVFRNVEYQLVLGFANGKLLAITDNAAPNLRIAEVRLSPDLNHNFIDLVPETHSRIVSWLVLKNYFAVSYLDGLSYRIVIYDSSGQKVEEVPLPDRSTVRLKAGSSDQNTIVYETESFSDPITINTYNPETHDTYLFAKRAVPFEPSGYDTAHLSYTSKDGTEIPISLVGRSDVVERGDSPTIMTAYGGYGVPMTPQFSVFVAFLLERGCVFALPNIRGGSEFGTQWHHAAKRRNRQTAFDDFLAAAEFLIKSGRTRPEKLAIFGGSNSGLLVAAALTQRPDLFRAVVCMVPMLDMLRYHLFDNAHVWKDEFGTSDDPQDFEALLRYSPYHNVPDSRYYPAVMFVSGDKDRNCNPLHARKMVARLQAANTSSNPIFLDYSSVRGHSPVLPLTDRVHALTDRMAFLCDQLGLAT